MVEIDIDSPQAEHKYHTYQGAYIPIYVRLLWVGFHILAIYYVLRFMFPAMREEFRPQTQPQPKSAVVDTVK